MSLAKRSRSVRVDKLKAEDVVKLSVLKANPFIGPVLSADQVASLENTPHACSVFVDGDLIVCGGVTEYWAGRGEAWAIFHPEGRKYFATIQRVTREFFDRCPIRRVEASIACDFSVGKRWVESLGFKLECERLRSFFPDGGDATLYSRLR